MCSGSGNPTSAQACRSNFGQSNQKKLIRLQEQSCLPFLGGEGGAVSGLLDYKVPMVVKNDAFAELCIHR